MRTRLGSLLIVAVGCGPGVPMDATDTTGQTSAATSSTTSPTSTDAVTSTTSGAATSSGGDAGASSTDGETGAPTSTGGETGEATATGGATGEASVTVATSDTGDTGDTNDTTAAGTTEESSTGEPGGVTYRAEYYLGQINRITVYRADFDADNCAQIEFAEIGSDPESSVTLPPSWQVEWTQVSQGTSNCFGGVPGQAWEKADSVMGMADWEPFMPCMADIDVTATFPQTEPWVPGAVHFLATDVPVEGAC